MSAPLGSRLQIARVNCGLSSQQASRLLKLPHEEIMRHEEEGSPQNLIATYAQTYDVSIDWLTKGSSLAPTQAATLRLAAREGKKASDEDVEALIEFVGTLRAQQ